MINWPKLNPLKRQGHATLLGLTLDGSRLDGVVVHRTNGTLQVHQTFSVTLSLDPLTADPELVGREIRNHLDAAGVRERHCVVCVPLKWALTTHAELPDLPEADEASFLQIEAERGFPYDVATLRVSTSRYVGPSRKQRALLVGIPGNQLALLERVLQEAKLKPVSFSFGITALQPPDASHGVLALAVGERQVDLQITCGGGVAALRVLEGALETEGSQTSLHADLVARETRITLGQLPEEFRETVSCVRIFGPLDLAEELAEEMQLRMEPMGLKVELATRYAPDEFNVQLPQEAPISPALSLAARHLAGVGTPFEFLPPKVTAWQQLATRYSSERLQMVGATAGAVIVVVAGLFLIQEWQLVRLRSRWAAMSPRVSTLDGMQQQIVQYRPWFDNSFRCLSILRQLTMAFPEDGAVSAKTVEIRDVNTVTCSGTARDNTALLKALSQLRAANGVTDLKVDQIRGKSPMQFTFDFRWNEGGRNEN